MRRPCVLVLAGLDPSGGAGITADVQAIAAQGAHALPVVTALTVQDQNRVYAVQPVDPALLDQQLQALTAALPLAAVKIGICGSLANAAALATQLAALRARQPALPIVLDPVLASGRGDPLARDDARLAVQTLLPLASVVLPNGPEAAALGLDGPWQGGPEVLQTGGHGDGPEVCNRWRGPHGERSWRWPRLDGEFHGSGCTLAASLAACLALGEPLDAALQAAQAYTHATLAGAYAIGPGQRIPERWCEKEI
ncbi:bifunctional hydroxymethylpyrimidine kinase/phosphomethylpyrimidine kinase [Massilia sp. TS11]|uniref:bifunctional hydroxymethylpyrimidine kinase/phosphomethylpyrimidine kinase n=1 Tax=Massilia sp. TS11 TaxID=2908003 RepID=UPI001EDBA5A9|nr:bifunctional hydroxymethylpyrimidine kinase/phosphomethylpyrimidine kinase [Massilia sp. TS11]MCG2585410.1 bifunctional hydroxymethylpyrimidine kinase/phosphomethylpyrimidine kinase [Massilia sp. TS11]